MPNPFSNTPPAESTVADAVPVLNSCLTCEFCFVDSDEGTYYTKTETLSWICEACGKVNVVKGIKL